MNFFKKQEKNFKKKRLKGTTSEILTHKHLDA